MAIKNIRYLNDPILRKKSKRVDNIDKKIHHILKDMAETMYHADGVGIAAPQIGILKRIVVIDIGDGIINLINPEIVEMMGYRIAIEGCLSIPDKLGKVERPNIVTVKAFNEKGEEFMLRGEGRLAKALCHELEHLDGILYIDKMLGYIENI